MTVCGAQSFLKSFEKTSRVRRKPREVSGAKAMGRGLVSYDSGCGLALSATGLVGHRRASKRQGVQVRAGGPELNEIESFFAWNSSRREDSQRSVGGAGGGEPFSSRQGWHGTVDVSQSLQLLLAEGLGQVLR